jgi:hypothetical protein
MKLKKIIAREFLFLLSASALLGLIFIGLKIYNALEKVKMESFRTEAKLVENNYSEFISQPLKTKDSVLDQSCLNRIINFYKQNSNIDSENTIYSKFPELKRDSILLNASLDYNTTMNSGKYKSLKEVNLKFPEFFIINQSEIDSLNKYKSRLELLRNKILKHKNNIFTLDDILEYLFVCFFYILIVSFGFRYLYYSTSWAIRTIRTKE